MCASTRPVFQHTLTERLRASHSALIRPSGTFPQWGKGEERGLSFILPLGGGGVSAPEGCFLNHTPTLRRRIIIMQLPQCDIKPRAVQPDVALVLAHSKPRKRTQIRQRVFH